MHCQRSIRQSRTFVSDWKQRLAVTMYIIVPVGRPPWFGHPWVKKTKENPIHEVLQTSGIIPAAKPCFDRVYQIRQFRRQNRTVVNNMRERTYYLDGKIVAKNRKARFEQKTDSLETWFAKTVEAYGLQTAERMRSRLSVKKSHPVL